MFELSTTATRAAIAIEFLRAGQPLPEPRAISDFVDLVEKRLAEYEAASVLFADNPIGGLFAQSNELLGGMEKLVGKYGDRFSIGTEISGVTYHPDLVDELYAAARELIERVDAIDRRTVTENHVLLATALELTEFAGASRIAADPGWDSLRRRMTAPA